MTTPPPTPRPPTPASPRPTFAGRAPVVIKIGGAALDQPDRCAHLWDELSRASRPIVLVHGGGAGVDAALARLGLPVVRREGIRVTPPDQIDEVVGVLAGRLNTAIVGWLVARGCPAVGLTLGDAGLTRSRATTRFAFDVGRVGEISGGDPSLARLLLDHAFLPVVSSIGLDAEGAPLNLNADDAAAGLARLLDAEDLVLLTDVDGVRDAEGRRLASISAAQIGDLVDRGVIRGGMIPKARAAADAASGAGCRVTVCSWREPDSLRDALAGRPAGTRVVSDGETTRPLSR